jgi:HlyD family secretion protein
MTVAIDGAIGGFVFWAENTEIAGAVVANGTVVVESHAKLVQHQDGGIIKSILIGDDEAVTAGQLLLTLDDTRIRATLDAATSRLNEALVEQARLEAEIADKAAFVIPSGLAGTSAIDVVATQKQILASELTDREVQVAQLREQIAQLNHQADGLTMQQQAIVAQLDILKTRTATVDSLLAKQLAHR